MDPQVFGRSEDSPTQVVDTLVAHLQALYSRSYPWAIGRGRQTPSGYILSKAKKEYRSGRPIISFVDAPFRPMLNILARLLYQLIPVECPHHFAVGGVYGLLTILKSIPENQSLRLFNQDLAGFFTSIEPARFIGAWYMLLDFLRPKMNVNNEEVFSVYPGKSNKPGDLIKGRTFRRLNVTRKIVIGDVPSLLTTALDMQTFALGGRCIKQRRGSPMGSPLPRLSALSVHPSPGLTSFVPHPRRLPNPASSSRPDTEFTVFTSTVDGQTETFIGPPAISGPDLPSPAVIEGRSAAPASLSTHPTPGSRPPPRGLSISRPPPVPPSRPFPFNDDALCAVPATTVPATTPASGAPSSGPPSALPTTPPATILDSADLSPHPPSPVMAPDRRVKRRRVTPAATPASTRPGSDMPPPAPPSSVAPPPLPDTVNPSASTAHPAPVPILPVPESPPPHPSADPAHSSDSDDSNLSTRPPSPPPAESSSIPGSGGPRPPISDLFRNWAPVDDNELITYKKDTRARPSWKTIGQRLHRSAESCRARWLWLKSTGRDKTNVLDPPRNEGD
eukprot:s534_g26.t1